MLTDSAIRTAKPKEKPYKLADGQGLHLHIASAGGIRRSAGADRQSAARQFRPVRRAQDKAVVNRSASRTSRGQPLRHSRVGGSSKGK